MESLEEELRLLYVAATRAKDKLVLVYPGQGLFHNAQGWGANHQGGLTSFVRALPPEIIEYRSTGSSSYTPYRAPFPPGIIPDTPEAPPADQSALKPGDRINHPAFGAGVIARFLGEDRVEVIFRDRGLKLLHLGYTSLEKV